MVAGFLDLVKICLAALASPGTGVSRLLAPEMLWGPSRSGRTFGRKDRIKENEHAHHSTCHKKPFKAGNCHLFTTPWHRHSSRVERHHCGLLRLRPSLQFCRHRFFHSPWNHWTGAFGQHPSGLWQPQTSTLFVHPSFLRSPLPPGPAKPALYQGDLLLLPPSRESDFQCESPHSFWTLRSRRRLQTVELSRWPLDLRQRQTSVRNYCHRVYMQGRTPANIKCTDPLWSSLSRGTKRMPPIPKGELEDG